MTRLPSRWKVTLAFAVALLVVLCAVGTFLYVRFDADLGESVDRGLQARAGELRAQVQRSPDGFSGADARAVEADESVAQVLRRDGTVVAATSEAGASLLSEAQLSRAGTTELLADRPGDKLLDEEIRVLAFPVSARGESLILVVGGSLDEQREALSALLVLELIGLTAALLLASGAGYVVAGVALRPVEAMRRRAEEITDQPDRRLPVPPIDDELGRLGATLNAMLDRLGRAQAAEREAIAKERRFVADASHELRTPLSILKSEIEVALLGRRSVEELEAALESTGEETDRLCRLAEDLLVLAQADEGDLPIHPASVDVGDLLVDTAHRHGSRAEAAGLRITARTPAVVEVTADRRRMDQALTNLVDNALRHGVGDVELTARHVSSGVEIAVRDHGTGFPEDFGGRAFERFTRAETGRTGTGAGLGLAIVQAVALAHGGSVDIEDAEPGARVRITLPQT